MRIRHPLVAVATVATVVLGSADPSRASAAADGAEVPSGMPPAAMGGHCVARVTVPPLWDVEPVEIERQAADARFEIAPATLERRTRRVVLHDASTSLRVVPPVLERETVRRELAPATTRWVRGGPEGERPMSPGDRLDLVAAGIEPDDVAPGTCLAEHRRPARISTTPERVLVREASEQLGVVDAVFETVTEPLVTRAAHARLIEVPTVWETGTQRVMTQAPGAIGAAAVFEARPRVTVGQPAAITRVVEPAEQENIEVRRLVTDAYGTREPLAAEWGTIEVPRVEEPGGYVWLVDGTDGAGNASDADGADETDEAGEADETEGTDASLATSEDASIGAALPEGEAPVPTGRVLCHREWPAETLDYERLVVREEGRFERERRPAEHVVREIDVLVDDARGTRVEVPAVVETIERRVPLRAARDDWYPVMCEAALDRRFVTALQRALARERFSPGAIDGRIGPATLGAVTRYQQANGLASGALTLEAVEALGVAP